MRANPNRMNLLHVSSIRQPRKGEPEAYGRRSFGCSFEILSMLRVFFPYNSIQFLQAKGTTLCLDCSPVNTRVTSSSCWPLPTKTASIPGQLLLNGDFRLHPGESFSLSSMLGLRDDEGLGVLKTRIRRLASAQFACKFWAVAVRVLSVFGCVPVCHNSTNISDKCNALAKPAEFASDGTKGR